MAIQRLYGHDLDQTIQNRKRLLQNRNLLFWYECLYADLFRGIADIDRKRILEIGSGTSPLKMFLPHVITSDILKLDYLDIIFDCHDIRNCEQVPNNSIDIITLTNVLHHLSDPIRFLCEATTKLSHGGFLFIVEPYFSALSYPLYKILHPEATSFNCAHPILDDVQGPLSSSNQAIPYMIFFSRQDWLLRLSAHYDLEKTHVEYFSSLAYMATGGISRIFPCPHALYRRLFTFDKRFAAKFPRLFASFFTAKLISKND